jgi:hypothetical protein
LARRRGTLVYHLLTLAACVTRNTVASEVSDEINTCSTIATRTRVALINLSLTLLARVTRCTCTRVAASCDKQRVTHLTHMSRTHVHMCWHSAIGNV